MSCSLKHDAVQKEFVLVWINEIPKGVLEHISNLQAFVLQELVLGSLSLLPLGVHMGFPFNSAFLRLTGASNRPHIFSGWPTRWTPWTLDLWPSSGFPFCFLTWTVPASKILNLPIFANLLCRASSSWWPNAEGVGGAYVADVTWQCVKLYGGPPASEGFRMDASSSPKMCLF